MALSVGQTYHGFTLLEIRTLKEITSQGHVFEHRDSGAKLVYYTNADANKVFAVAFRTPPKDSTGTPHILEHSVLCGSRKFKTKEPFVDLCKGSLQTFLNAFTYNDKTVYPAASQNAKDFRNLMDVYLDAVFYPAIYDTQDFFHQEGWHHHLEDKGASVEYRGVVYSEMQGVYSSPESILERRAEQVLFPDTPYHHDSGGDPDAIPTLTYEDYIAFHTRYYHPSNALISVYGDGDVLSDLQFINEEYLSQFHVTDAPMTAEDAGAGAEAKRQFTVSRPPPPAEMIPLQPAFTARREHHVYYPVDAVSDDAEEDGSEEEEEGNPQEESGKETSDAKAITAAEKAVRNKTFHSLHWAVGTNYDPVTYVAFEMLKYLLIDTSSSPLKQALLKANIGEDVYGEFDTSLVQPRFSIVLRSSNPEHAATFEKIVMDTLKTLATEGVDKKLAEAAFNHEEFDLREADFHSYPKGLIYILGSLDSWLHGKDPFMHLEFEATLEKIRVPALEGTLFDDLIRTHLLENTHCVQLTVEPKPGMEEEHQQRVKGTLADYQASLSEAEVDRLVEETQHLLEFQKACDTPEALATIPLLPLSEVDKKDRVYSVVESAIRSPATADAKSGSVPVPVLTHTTFTAGIAYVSLKFDTGAVPLDQVAFLPLLAAALGKVRTIKRGFTELSNEVDIAMGGLEFKVDTIRHTSDAQLYRPLLAVDMKCLVSKLPRAMELLAEVLTESQFDDAKRMREIVNEMKSKYEMRINRSGHNYASGRLDAYAGGAGLYREWTGGIAHYHWARALAGLYSAGGGESAQAATRAALDNVRALSVRPDALLVGLTCGETSCHEHAQSPTASAACAAVASRVETQLVPALAAFAAGSSGAGSGISRWDSPNSGAEAGLARLVPTTAPYTFNGPASEPVPKDASGGGTMAVRLPIPHSLETVNEGLCTSSKVQYVAKGTTLSTTTKSSGRKAGDVESVEAEFVYHGAMAVLAQLGSLDYLWNALRVQGGAYGCWLSIDRRGMLRFLSYRDPNLVDSLKVYDAAGEWVSSMDMDARELTKAVLGAIGSRDAPLTPAMRGRTALSRTLSGLNPDAIQRARDEMLSCTNADLRALGTVIARSLAKANVCVLGNAEKLRAQPSIFGGFVAVFE